MSVREINEVHHDYIEIFERVKAAWTYHQFLRGVGHVFVEESVSFATDVDFKPLFSELKAASEELNTVTVTKVRSRLDGVTSDLAKIVSILEEEDSKLSPSFLRLFFQRVRSYDEQVLIRMIRFFLGIQAGRKWSPSRIDKVDYVATCLAESICGPELAGHLAKLQPLLKKFWTGASADPLPPGALEACRSRLDALDAEIEGLTSLAHMRRIELLPRYREFKHGLGRGFFMPELLERILRTNLRLRALVRQFYSHEERRLFADYEALAEIERVVTLDGRLGAEVTAVHEEVERFERRVQDNNVRLADLEDVRERVSKLLPEVQKMGQSDRPAAASPEAFPAELVETFAEMPSWMRLDRNLEFVALLRHLDTAGDSLSAAEVVHLPEVVPYELDEREVTAYRKLKNGGGGRLEALVMASAALRRRIERDADEIRNLPRDEPVEDGSEGIIRVRQELRVSEQIMAELQDAVGRAESAGGEAAQLQRLRMRLMRSYAEIWLLIYPLSVTDSAD